MQREPWIDPDLLAALVGDALNAIQAKLDEVFEMSAGREDWIVASLLRRTLQMELADNLLAEAQIGQFSAAISRGQRVNLVSSTSSNK